MSKTLIILGTLSTSLALASTVPTLAHGSSHGGGPFSGSSHLGALASVAKSEASFKLIQQPARNISRDIAKNDHAKHDRVVRSEQESKSHERTHTRAAERVVHKQTLKPNSTKAVVLTTTNPSAVKKSNMSEHMHKLTSAQYQSAKIVDDHGRKYDLLKKAWWDGRHWWFGRYSWLFIDDTWYYGDTIWSEKDGSWGCDLAEQPVCLDCPVREAAVAEQPLVAVTSNAPDISSQASTAIKPAKIVPLPIQQTQSPSTKVSLPPPAPQQPVASTPVIGQVAATVAKTPPDLVAVPTGALLDPAAPARVECMRYLPQLSMTVTVPCTE